MTDSEPSDRSHAKKPIPVYAQLHETPGDHIWKLVGRASQLVGTASAVASIIVLVIIQGNVNELNDKTRKVDRSLEFVRQLRTQNASTQDLDDLLHRVSMFGQMLTDDEKDIKLTFHDYVVSLAKEAPSIKVTLESQLKEYEGIHSCMELDICDEYTIETFLGDRMRTTFVYMRPLFMCDDYFVDGGLDQGLTTLITRFYKDIEPEYDCPVAEVTTASVD